MNNCYAGLEILHYRRQFSEIGSVRNRGINGMNAI